VDRGHGREERRTPKAVTVKSGLLFPHAAQAIRHLARDVTRTLAILGLT
jgi:hypothetical protein